MYSFLWRNTDLWKCLVEKKEISSDVCFNIRMNDI